MEIRQAKDIPLRSRPRKKRLDPHFRECCNAFEAFQHFLEVNEFPLANNIRLSREKEGLALTRFEENH